MDPKDCGKLLTHHRRGYGVDVEALRDRIPLRWIAEKGPKMGSHRYRRLRRWKSGLVAPGCIQGIWVYIGEISRSVELRGAHKGGGRAWPPGRAALPRGLLAASLTSTPSLPYCFLSKNNFSEGFIPFGLCLIFLFFKTLKQGKNRNWHWALG